jgi:hypothetical protein
MTKYISDIISGRELRSWQCGDRILISGGTGSGKTNFIINDLYSHCKENRKKILLLVNRVMLRDQIENTDFDQTLTIKLYQSIEAGIIKESYNNAFTFEEYDYVVFDEAHYFFTDSDFSNKTDLILNLVAQDYPEKILIFMTATPYNLTDVDVVRNTLPPYIIEKNADFIENLYFYTVRKNSDKILKMIIKAVPENSKLIYFGKALNSYMLSKEFEGSIFLCSEGNKRFSGYMDSGSKDEISKNEKFNSKYLFTTRVLDNGVSLSDQAIKYIVIDDSIDPIIVLQMLGRKRIINEKDKINLYVRDHAINAIIGKLNPIREAVKDINEYHRLGRDSFIEEKKKVKVADVFDTDGYINKAKEFTMRYKEKMYTYMTKLPYGYKQYICNILGFSLEETKFANREYREISTKEVLEKYSGRKLFKEEQEQFKSDFIVAMLDPRKNRGVGLQTIKGMLVDNHLKYIMESGRDRNLEERDRTYWIIFPMENDLPRLI